MSLKDKLYEIYEIGCKQSEGYFSIVLSCDIFQVPVVNY